MQIFFLKGLGQSTRACSGWRWVIAGAGLALCLGAGVFYLGSTYGQYRAHHQTVSETQLYQAEVVAQQQRLEGLQSRVDMSLSALSVRLARMQAQMLRFNALGQRVVDEAGLDADEFDFSSEVPMGGLESEAQVGAHNFDSLDAQLKTLADQIQERMLQLGALESILAGRNLRQDFLPQGRPIKQGWLSSYYGWRNDPFTGRRAFHHGVDFAGKKGGDVIAVAAGLVTYAGPKGGYGRLIEIDHGAGYVTRYGHNAAVLVKAGDIVSRGDVIGRIGSSGRSTGPHVHFEILRAGRSINPYKYIRLAGH